MKILLFLCFGVSLLFFSPHAFASCGASSCPIDHHKYMMPGMFRFSVNYENIRMDKLRFGTRAVSIGEIAADHNEIETLNQRTSLMVDYGVSKNFSLNLTAPYIVREHSHIAHHNDDDEIEQWNFSGLGDIMAHGTYIISQSTETDVPYFAITAGIKFPTGATNKTNHDGEKAEVTIQPGTGSFDGVIGVNARYIVGSVQSLDGVYAAIPLTASLTARVNGKGIDGYKIGNEIVGSLGSSFALNQTFQFLFQLNGRWQDFAGMGTTGEERSNTGGAWLYASPGIAAEIFSNISLFVYGQIPLYQNVHGVQQVSSFNVQAGISYHASIF